MIIFHFFSPILHYFCNMQLVFLFLIYSRLSAQLSSTFDIIGEKYVRGKKKNSL